MLCTIPPQDTHHITHWSTADLNVLLGEMQEDPWAMNTKQVLKVQKETGGVKYEYV